jgi:phosphatidylserine/phosphatidylglycerophosphate/cardiolipin synthase-like enzyme
MKTTLAVYANADDVLLVWSVDELDDACGGFGVQRERTAHGRASAPKWLDNYAPPGPKDHQKALHHPSDARPFRRFSWTDHEVGPGDEVRYRVVPVIAGAPDETLASAWSEKRKLGAADGAYTPFFNRGFVISQFMSRYLDERYPGMERGAALERFVKDIGDAEDVIRGFLSGQLRTAVLDLLAGVGADEHVHAALFELTDPELIEALAALGPRAHVVLSNGSIEKRDGETSAQARERDENGDARGLLRAKGADVAEKDRFISPGALGHNKFVVVADAAGRAVRAWTGSTNWSTTGLCTQLNNGLLIHDEAVAAAYLAQWNLLLAARSEHPRTLSAANGAPADVNGAAVRTTVHFTRAQKRVDLAALSEIVAGAKEGLLFLMFIPGASGVVAAVKQLAADRPDTLVRGVISELPKGTQDEQTGDTTTVKVTLFGDPSAPQPIARTFDVVQPSNFQHVAAGWAVETTRGQFLGHVGHAIIHSKVLVVDAFSDHPTVVTGSHNFSISASEKNDENFIVVRGDRALAEAYAVNIESAWRHYAARIGTPHATLTGIEYLRALLADQRGEERFWQVA